MRDVLERYFHGAYGFLGVLARDGTLLAANRTALDAGGLRAEDVQGQPLWQTRWWSGAPAARDALRAAIDRAAAGELVRYEAQLRGRGDAPLWLDLSLGPLRDERGAVDLVLLEGRDITRHKQLEAARARDDALLRDVVDAQTELVSRLRVDRTLLFVNDAYCRFFGRAREDLIGKSSEPIAHPDDLPKILAALAALTPEDPVVVMENRVFDGEGRVRWLEFVNRGFFDPQGALVEIQSIGRDVTLRRQGEAERLQAQQRLQELQKLESLGLLAGGVAHDFNNILTCITASAGLVRRELAGSPALELIAEIEQAAARAGELCQQMLAYAGKRSAPHVPLDLGALIHELLPLLRPALARGASLELDLGRDVPVILGDATQLRQVLLNLVVNAAEACQGSGGVVTIATRRRRGGPELQRAHPLAPPPGTGEFASLSVRDNGVGMPPETRARVFEPFFTTKATGRGLGLSATLGIVRAHDGAIDVDSEPGRGTTFEVLLPATDAPRPGAPARPDAPRFRGEGLALLVDDEPSIRRLLARALAGLGCTVVQASDGDEGLAAFEAHAPALRLALVDVTMPRMGGDALLRALRRRRPDLPAIVMSGYSAARIEERFADCRVDGFLQEPFALDELHRCLERVAARR